MDQGRPWRLTPMGSHRGHRVYQVQKQELQEQTWLWVRGGRGRAPSSICSGAQLAT